MDEAPGSNTPNNRSNTFLNDGSFMEKFKQMQQLQQQKDKAQESIDNVKSVPLMSASSSRVTKSGAIVVKLSGVKKRTTDKTKKVRDVGVKKAFKGSSSSESEGEEESSSLHGGTGATSSGAVACTTTTGGASVSGCGTPIGSTASGTVGPVKAQSSPAVTGQKRKRASRWGVQPPASAEPPPIETMKEDVAISAAIASFSGAPKVQSQQQDLTEAQQQQLKEQIEMNKIVAEIRTAQQKYSSKPPPGKKKKKNVYEYDSDEDVEGGTWEHKKRKDEMYGTETKAVELTEKGKGKHHIGDFLPPEELEKFVEKVQAIKEDRDPDFSEYKAHKLTEENVGFRMLQKAGWKEGAGLGTQEDGITAPINKGKRSFDQAGVGAETPGEVKKEDDPFDVYRKRMMLAYRFRPNPLNNPRRPYY